MQRGQTATHARPLGIGATTGSIAAFVHGSLQLLQVLFARSGVNEIPWTRADIYPH